MIDLQNPSYSSHFESSQPVLPFSLHGLRIFVAGHRGMVGQAVMRRLALESCTLLIADRTELDLTRQADVENWLKNQQPDMVILAAGRVGGILANASAPAPFLYENLMIAANLIEAAYRVGVKKLLYLGSSCIYPRDAPQPLVPQALLSGPLEPTNQWYALAKIAGLKLCEAYRQNYGCDYISAMPCNLYGPGDRFDLTVGHVVSALLIKAHMARISKTPFLEIWGSGKPRREFLHVDDLADGLVHLLKNYSQAETVNIGSGKDLTIAELAKLVVEVVGYEGDLVFDLTKPDGTMRKVLDIEPMTKLGWQPKIALRDGLMQAYKWYCDHV